MHKKAGFSCSGAVCTGEELDCCISESGAAGTCDAYFKHKDYLYVM